MYNPYTSPILSGTTAFVQSYLQHMGQMDSERRWQQSYQLQKDQQVTADRHFEQNMNLQTQINADANTRNAARIKADQDQFRQTQDIEIMKQGVALLMKGKGGVTVDDDGVETITAGDAQLYDQGFQMIRSTEIGKKLFGADTDQVSQVLGTPLGSATGGIVPAMEAKQTRSAPGDINVPLPELQAVSNPNPNTSPVLQPHSAVTRLSVSGQYPQVNPNGGYEPANNPSTRTPLFQPTAQVPYTPAPFGGIGSVAKFIPPTPADILPLDVNNVKIGTNLFNQVGTEPTAGPTAGQRNRTQVNGAYDLSSSINQSYIDLAEKYTSLSQAESNPDSTVIQTGNITKIIPTKKEVDEKGMVKTKTPYGSTMVQGITPDDYVTQSETAAGWVPDSTRVFANDKNEGPASMTSYGWFRHQVGSLANQPNDINENTYARGRAAYMKRVQAQHPGDSWFWGAVPTTQEADTSTIMAMPKISSKEATILNPFLQAAEDKVQQAMGTNLNDQAVQQGMGTARSSFHNLSKHVQMMLAKEIAESAGPEQIDPVLALYLVANEAEKYGKHNEIFNDYDRVKGKDFVQTLNLDRVPATPLGDKILWLLPDGDFAFTPSWSEVPPEIKNYNLPTQ